MSKNAIIGFAPLMALCAVMIEGQNLISRGMKWRRWWTRRQYVQRGKQFRNRRGDGISKGVLVAISIPIFTSQLEKSREATDEANIRSIYAQLSADVLTENTAATLAQCPAAASYSVTKNASTGVVTGEATYTMTQQKDGTENGQDLELGGVAITSANFKKGTCTIKIYSDGTATEISIA